MNQPFVIERQGFRQRLACWIESPVPRNFILALIILNALILGLETSPHVLELTGPWLARLNAAILAVFVMEIAIKLIARDIRFFHSGWNWFDFLVVGISLVPSTGPLEILRSLRVLRVLRLLSQVERLRHIIESLLRAMPGIAWTSLLLLLVFYVFAIMGVGLFGETFPQWFGTLGRSLFALFQTMTLESWATGIARPVMEVHAWAWMYFLPFILLASFMVLNLFIAIIVSATQSIHAEEEENQHQQLLEELQSIRREIDALKVMDR